MIRLRELSIRRGRLEDRLMNKSEQLILHLFKIFYHGKDEGKREHWSGDLYDILYWIPSLERSHKFLRKEDIYYNLWGYAEDRFSAVSTGTINRLNRISKSEKEGGFGIIKDKTSNPDCAEFCKGYFLWLSDKLSKEGEVTEDDIRKEIELLYKGKAHV